MSLIQLQKEITRRERSIIIQNIQFLDLKKCFQISNNMQRESALFYAIIKTTKTFS